MEKILNVISKIIDNQDLISDVKKSNTELYFVFSSKYKFSINHDGNQNQYFFHMYPNPNHSLIDIINADWLDYKEYLTYNSNDLGQVHIFADLYNILNVKLYDADKIIDDILNL